METKQMQNTTIVSEPGCQGANDTWQYGQVNSPALNVRKQPSLSAARWDGYWPIRRIILVKPAAEGWYETLYRGEKAFVSAKYIHLLPDQVSANIVERMNFMAVPELGRNNSIYFNGYGGKWCHRFADWLTMNAGMPKERIPNVGNCGWGIVWFVQHQRFYFKNASHKLRMIRAYPEIRSLSSALTDLEASYLPVPGDYIYFRWNNSSANVNHVGIVRSVSSQAVITWEGNSGGKVVTKEFLLNDSRIVGFGKPDYPSPLPEQINL